MAAAQEGQKKSDPRGHVDARHSIAMNDSEGFTDECGGHSSNLSAWEERLVDLSSGEPELQ